MTYRYIGLVRDSRAYSAMVGCGRGLADQETSALDRGVVNSAIAAAGLPLFAYDGMWAAVVHAVA